MFWNGELRGRVMIAIIGGTSFLESALFSDLEEKIVETEYGEAQTFQGMGYVFIQRHGEKADTPPHRINYHANVQAVKELNVSKIIGINSTGSLKKTIVPGSLLIPHDYFNLFNIPTFFDNELKFTIPGLDRGLIKVITQIAKHHKIKVIPEGIYFQVRGPVLETPSEINFIKQIGDVVGMTMTNEAILARERDLKYASICMVDNYANGIVDTPLTMDQIVMKRKQNLGKLENFLTVIIKHLIDD